MLREFPPIAEALVDKSVLKTYGKIIKMDISSESEKLLARTLVNEAQLSAIVEPSMAQRRRKSVAPKLSCRP